MEEASIPQRAHQMPLLEVPNLDKPGKSTIAGICTLASQDLLEQLRADDSVTQQAIVGPLTTENLGVEKLVRTVLQTPDLRFLILCGHEARGHYGGQAIQALVAHGVDSDGRIREARGPRPLLANLRVDAIDLFRNQVTVVDLIGCDEAALVRAQLAECARDYPGPMMYDDNLIEAQQSLAAYEIQASYDPYRDWVPDPSGFVLIRVDPTTRELVCEHYLNDHQFHVAIRGESAASVLYTLTQYQLLSRLDHAGYVGRELQKAELAQELGLPYVQDAPLRSARAGTVETR